MLVFLDHDSSPSISAKADLISADPISTDCI